MSTQQERIDALSKFLESTDTGARRPAPAKVTATGNVIEAGGTIERILIAPAQLTYAAGTPPVLHYPKAGPGDTILVNAKQAERLDRLGVTVETIDDVDEAVELAADGLLTDEQINTAGAAELVAFVAQHPAERERVRALEEARPAKKRRATVMAATEPTPEADLAAEAELASRQPEPPIEETDVTVDAGIVEDTDLEERILDATDTGADLANTVVDTVVDGPWDDERIRTAPAAELAAYAADADDDTRARIRAIEEERSETKRRASVMAATEA